jgi:hypothetical protein
MQVKHKHQPNSDIDKRRLTCSQTTSTQTSTSPVHLLAAATETPVANPDPGVFTPGEILW